MLRFLCTGKVDRNVVQHAKSVEKKTGKGVKRRVKDEHLHLVTIWMPYIAFKCLSADKI